MDVHIGLLLLIANRNERNSSQVFLAYATSGHSSAVKGFVVSIGVS
jgi:hypothetical protein